MLTIYKTIKIQLVVTGVFALLCFIPIIQVIFLTYDGGLLSVANKLLFHDNQAKIGAVNWIVNFSLSFIFLTLLYKTKSKTGQVTFSILSFLFLFCFIAFATMDASGGRDPYYLYFLTVTTIAGLIICGTAILKGKRSRAKTKGLPTTSAL